MSVSGTTATVSAPPRIYAAWQSLSEETGLAPAYMIGLDGCRRGCLFCHARGDWEAFAGEELSRESLAHHFRRAREWQCCTIQFTGGEPGWRLAEIESALPAAGDLPLVLNTSLDQPLHLQAELLAAFKLVIVSLKFGRDQCAARLGCGSDYLGPMRERLVAMYEAGIPLRVRHLVMPGHLDCCLRPTLDWLVRELPLVPVTLLLGFVPPPRPQVPELQRTLTLDERHAALAQATRSGLCWEAVGAQIPAMKGHGTGPELVDVVIDAAGAICLPTMGPAAQALAAGLCAACEEEIP